MALVEEGGLRVFLLLVEKKGKGRCGKRRIDDQF